MLINRRRYLVAIAIFTASYTLFLCGWMYVGKDYGRLCVAAGGTISALLTDNWHLSDVENSGDEIKASFYTFVSNGKMLGNMLIDIKIDYSSFTFNVPLSLAMIVSLMHLFRLSWRVLVEVILLLFAVHLIYVVSFCSLQMLLYLRASGGNVGLTAGSETLQLFWEFADTFADNLLIRFEPFLFAVYLWIRANRRIQNSC